MGYVCLGPVQCCGHRGKNTGLHNCPRQREAIPQMLFTGYSELPHFIVGAEETEFFAKACEEGLRFRGFAEAKWQEDADCIDVVGTIGSGSRKIIICGHYDTVYSTPGAYDNAAGTAVVLELARRLKKV